MNNLRLLLLAVLSLTLTSCASHQSGPAMEFSENCEPTSIELEIVDIPPSEFWSQRLNNSLPVVNRILSSPDFFQECSTTWMTNKQGNSSAQICEQLVCGGERIVKIGFYHDENTSGIAGTGMINRIIKINTAHPNRDGGLPANLIHEYMHVLGYKHFTNIRLFAQTSVPYKVGDLSERYIDHRESEPD